MMHADLSTSAILAFTDVTASVVYGSHDLFHSAGRAITPGRGRDIARCQVWIADHYGEPDRFPRW